MPASKEAPCKRTGWPTLTWAPPCVPLAFPLHRSEPGRAEADQSIWVEAEDEHGQELRGYLSRMSGRETAAERDCACHTALPRYRPPSLPQDQAALLIARGRCTLSGAWSPARFWCRKVLGGPAVAAAGARRRPTNPRGEKRRPPVHPAKFRHGLLWCNTPY